MPRAVHRVVLVAGLAGLAAVAGLVACERGGGPDDCQRFVDKSRPIMADMMRTGGREFSDQDAARMLAGCRKGGAKRDPVFACVLAATDDAAVRSCYLEGITGKPPAPAPAAPAAPATPPAP